MTKSEREPTPLWPTRPLSSGITHGEFANLARRRGWTVDFLAEQFAGQFGDERDPPRRLFDRILHERRLDAVVIPYRSVLAFYAKDVGLERSLVTTERLCRCGCGQHVFDRKMYATGACRERTRYRKSVMAQNGAKKPL